MDVLKAEHAAKREGSRKYPLWFFLVFSEFARKFR
jgi:hypothetical protein